MARSGEISAHGVHRCHERIQCLAGRRSLHFIPLTLHSGRDDILSAVLLHFRSNRLIFISLAANLFFTSPIRPPRLSPRTITQRLFINNRLPGYSIPQDHALCLRDTLEPWL